MRRRLSILCVCFAWLCANGAAAHTAQVFALGQLLVNFSHRLPAAQAFVKTCDDRHLCPICLAVEQAREDARNHPLPADNVSPQKLVLACQIVPAVFLTQAAKPFFFSDCRFAPFRTDQVPTQPPRHVG